MSTDYYIFNFDGPPPPDKVISVKGYKSVPMGTVEIVRAKIADHLPEVEWRSDDDFVGYVVDRGYAIEFFIAPDEDRLVYCIGVHPHGIAQAEPAMRRFCVPNNWYVFDPQEGRWIEPANLAGRAQEASGEQWPL
jgi:hypothetical protein